MKSVFLLKYTLRFFITLIVSNKNHGLQKKLFTEKSSFSVDYVKLIELDVVQSR